MSIFEANKKLAEAERAGFFAQIDKLQRQITMLYRHLNIIFVESQPEDKAIRLCPKCKHVPSPITRGVNTPGWFSTYQLTCTCECHLPKQTKTKGKKS